MRKVVFDAGHGGGDSGATNVLLNLMESDINLAVVEMALLAAGSEEAFKAYATRHTDEFLTLTERCQFANELGADLFVSVHCNSCDSPEPRGLETFYFQGSTEGFYLASLLGTKLLKAWCMIAGDEALWRGVKTAHFYVLEHTAMPAALVELGFLSNEKEAQLLASPDNQHWLALALVAAVSEFLDRG